MTGEMMNLPSLVEKASNGDPLCEMIAFAAERLMGIEVGALTRASHGDKSPNQPLDLVQATVHPVGEQIAPDQGPVAGQEAGFTCWPILLSRRDLASGARVS